MERRIAHLDMDAFYASVELLRHPKLRGQAVVVGGRRSGTPAAGSAPADRYTRLREYVGRGVITTATYEARALGVHSGMGLMRAAALAPEAILLPADFDAYRHYSRLFKQAVANIAPRIEDRGIDEIYIDLSELADDSMTVARRLKQAVREATGLSCSVAVSPNKLLSKIGSDLDKPDGLTVLSAADIPTRIWPLPLRKLHGVGPKAAEKLLAMGLHRIGDIAATPAERLLAHFGRSYGTWLARASRGEDERAVITESAPRSVSRETTFARDLALDEDRQLLGQAFTSLCERVAEDLQRKGYAGRTIGIKLRFEDFRTLTRDLTLAQAVMDATAVRRAAGACLRRIRIDKRIRLLGVRAGSLVPASAVHAAEHERTRQAPLPF